MSPARARIGTQYFLIALNVLLVVVNVVLILLVSNLYDRQESGCNRGNVVRDDIRTILTDSRFTIPSWRERALDPALSNRSC